MEVSRDKKLIYEDDQFPQFVVTRHELVEIVRYWADRRLGDDWLTFVSGDGIDRHLFYETLFMNKRINLAANILGEETVKEVIEEVENEFRAVAKARPGMTEHDWEIFTHGTAEQKEAMREKLEWYGEINLDGDLPALK